MKEENYPLFSVSADRKTLQKAGKIFLFLFLFVVSIAAIWVALTEFQSFSLPFLFSILLTFLLDPLVGYLESKGFSRTKATFVVFVVILLVFVITIWLLFPILLEQIKTIQEQLQGDYIKERFSIIIQDLEQNFTFLEGKDLNQKVGPALETVSEQMLNFALSLFSALSNVVIIPFITFFILIDGPGMKKGIIARVPNRYFEMVLNLFHKIEQQLGGYIRGQMIDAFWIGLLSVIALYIIGVDYYFFIGAIAGLANMIPYLGPIVGAVPAILVSLMQDPSFSPILMIIIAFAVIQLIDNVVISPLVVAKSVNIHPLVVIIVIFIGERLLGVLGMLIAVPVTGILNVIVKETIWSFKNYRLL